MLQLKTITVLMTLLVVSMMFTPTSSFGATKSQSVQNIAKSGDFVTLAGEGIDPDDDSLTISWKQVGGEEVELTPSNTVAEPTFKAPEVENGKVKILSFELTVTDPYGEVDTDIVKVNILPRNQPPTADAGPDQSVEKGDEVTLDGSGTDPDGDALTYRWTQIDGPIVELDDATSQTPSFDTSSITRSTGVLRFQLSVFDGFGGMARDTMIVKMTAAKATIVSANAGPDQIVDEGDNVQLDGVCTDKLDRELSYSWVQTLGPFVELSSTADPDPSFTAPEIPNGPIVPTAFRFTCQADGGGTATDVVIVRVRPINDDPTADAGPDKNTLSNRFVYLSGSGTDPDGDVLKYQWKQVSGDDVVIAYPTKGEARFKAPEVSGGQSTTLEFELTVTDPYGGKDTDSATVTVVSDNVRASADAGADQVVDEQTEVTLAGTGDDPDSESLTYAWKQVGGEKVELSDTESAEPTFTAPIVANGKVKILVFELRVADENGFPTKDTTKVTVLPVNSPPVVDAGEDQNVDDGVTVSLAGTASDEDEEPLTYLWNQIAGPTVDLSTTTDLATNFVAPKVGVDTVLTFQLVANDGQADSEPDTVDITVKGTLAKAMTAYAGKDQRVPEHSQVTLFGSGKDPLKNKLSYTWKQVSGEQVELSATDIAKPSFEAPEVANGQTKTLVFEITVSDDNGRTAKDTVTVIVDPINGAPTAIAKVKSVREAQ
ncbi:MAG: peptidase [Nitrososphaeria archaeon]|nr:peptidase [Nitrososphaeria archaeon]